MDAEGIGRAVTKIAQEIAERVKGSEEELAVVGIRRGGVHLARRLQGELAKLTHVEPPMGVLDIALYRDDVGEHGIPKVGPTQIGFEVNGKRIVLVDDVLYTGRT